MRTAAGVLALLLVADAAALARPHKRGHRPKAPPAAGSEAEGRAHLKKGTSLAAHGDCQAAIEEYTLAFDRLNDPVVLLARADCRQKVGQSAEAIEDYRAYLDESPDVGNRAEIEAKIAALEGAPPRAKEPPAKEAPPKEPPAPREVAAPKEPPRSREPTPAPAPESAPAAAGPPPAPEEAEGPHPKPLVGAAATTEAGEAEERPAGHPRPWLWVALGVLVAGGAAAVGYLYFQPKTPATPSTELGNYHF